MIERIGNILSGAQSAALQSIKNARELIDKVQLKLATGKEVNSALDNPLNYFTSLSLSQKASDLRRLLDNISLNIETIKTATAGAEGILKLLDTADALLADAVEELYPGEATSLVTSLSPADIAAILAANPGVSYSPASESFYQVSATAVPWPTANANAQAATLVEPPGVEGVAGVGGHLANITSQAENDFVNAITPGNAWLGGSDAGVEGEWRWTSGPEAGQQFWQGTAAGGPVGGSYARWGGGEPNNSGNEDVVHMRADGFWNDQAGTTSYNYVIEWDSSLFVTVADPALVERAGDYSKQYVSFFDQIDELARDAHYRGVGLLKDEKLRTDFNVDRTSYLVTEGIDATSSGLGLTSTNFLRLSTLNLAQEQVRDARQALRAYAGSLSVDLNVITIRLDFTKNTIDVHEAGATDLVILDEKEASAELITLQVRQQLQTEALRMSSQSNINRLFTG